MRQWDELKYWERVVFCLMLFAVIALIVIGSLQGGIEMTEEKLKELVAVMNFTKYQFERAMARLREYLNR